MKHIILTIAFILAMICIFALPPEVTSVVASQRTDGSRIVDILYNLADAENNPCTVSISVSSNGGATYEISPLPVNLSGDAGSNVTPGTGKHIVWNAGAESQAYNSNQYKFKVLAEDGTTNTTLPPHFVLVDGGTFTINTSIVTISPFMIDTYELTQTEYLAVMGSNPSYFTGVTDGPVEQVSWLSAIDFCNRRSINEGLTPCYTFTGYGTDSTTWPAGWNNVANNHNNISCNWSANGYRLPTEMEWMFAARGGNFSNGYAYSGSNTAADVAWYNSNSLSTTHPIGAKNQNELGTFDMSGNVREWVWDRYAAYQTGALTNPTGPSTGSYRTVRGGAFSQSIDGCLVTARLYQYAISGNLYSYGFRICRKV